MAIFKRELQIFIRRPIFLFCMILAPIFCTVFFTSLMYEGLPTNLPAGLVDEDDTQTSRKIVRTLDALEETEIVARYANFSDAHEAMRQGKIYAIFYIPKGTAEKAVAGRQPTISFYTNETFFVAGSLLMRDLRLTSELSGLSVTRQTLYAKGATERQAMGMIQPIVVEAHPINNSYLNYSVYLNNITAPGILFLMIMICTAYTIGLEWKNGTQKLLYSMAGESSTVAMVGKLLPQTALYFLLIIFIDVYLYKYMMFPCNCGIWAMIGIGFLTVLASQAFAVFVFGILVGQMRMSMSVCSLWGILSFSLTGFTFPVSAMHPVIQWLTNLFPLRHYYLIYVNQALNGYSIMYVWHSVVALMIFVLLPTLMLRRYRKAFRENKYIP